MSTKLCRKLNQMVELPNGWLYGVEIVNVSLKPDGTVTGKIRDVRGDGRLLQQNIGVNVHNVVGRSVITDYRGLVRGTWRA